MDAAAIEGGADHDGFLFEDASTTSILYMGISGQILLLFLSRWEKIWAGRYA